MTKTETNDVTNCKSIVDSSKDDDDESWKNNCCISKIDSICIGSGRFLRSVLVPALIEGGLKPMIVQTRGTSFQTYCQERRRRTTATSEKEEDSYYFDYEVDTVEFDGKISTESIPCFGVGSLGTEDGKKQVLDILQQISV